MEEPCKTITSKDGKLRLEVYQDCDAQDPRKEGFDDGLLGTMVCFHKRYTLGDKTDIKSDHFDGWSEMEEYIRKGLKGICIAPLFMYDHSGLRIKIGDFYGLLPQGHAEFDSGQIGFIYTTRKRCKELGVKLNYNNIQKQLASEVEVYDDYVSGSVYGFRLIRKLEPITTTCELCGHAETTPDEEEIDSCWGFYGYDIHTNGIVDHLTPEQVKELGLDGKKMEMKV